jgi:hypothetical protein
MHHLARPDGSPLSPSTHTTPRYHYRDHQNRLHTLFIAPDYIIQTPGPLSCFALVGDTYPPSRFRAHEATTTHTRPDTVH